MKLSFDAGKFLTLPNIFSGPTFAKLKNDLMSLMLGQKDEVFKRQADPDGTKWAPLSPATIQGRTKGKKKNNSSMILQDTGTLKNSLTDAGAPYGLRDESNNEITLGTNVPYAAMQNFGGTFTAKTLHEAPGGKSMMGVAVHIPARPFMGFGDQDSRDVSEYIEGFMSAEAKK